MATEIPAPATEIPAPAWIRYVGEGAAYLARFTIGPYKTTTVIAHGTPAAVPAGVAEALVGTGDFEPVEAATAIAAIADADAEAAREEAEWAAMQAEIQRRRQAAAPLRAIHAARLEAMRHAVIEGREAGDDEGQVVARAVARAVEFDETLKTLSRDAPSPDAPSRDAPSPLS